MFLKQISLRNFRNYEELVWSPSPGVNILWGDNGQGKTNLLEAIYVLANLRSFRTGRREELVQWSKERAYIRGIFAHPPSSRDLVVELALEGKGRLLRVNGKEPTTLGEFLGLITTFIFFPDSLLVVKGGPQERRRFFDRGIYNLHPWYLELVQRYNHVLKQRNTLLKSPPPRNRHLLEVWTEQYADLGSVIVGERLRYLHDLSEDLNRIKSDVLPGQTSLALCYHASFGEGFRFPLVPPEKTREQLQAEIRSHLIHHLKQREREEWRRGQSLIGPHRDDIYLFLNQKDIRLYGSQGEQRITVFLLTLAMLRNFRRHKEFFPIVLFDDVVSELDPGRRETILDFITQAGQQVFLTTTELTRIGEFVEGKALYQVKQGRLVREEKILHAQNGEQGNYESEQG